MVVHVWLRQGDGTRGNPRSDRIIASDHPWRETDFPPRKQRPDRIVREFRETDVPDEEWAFIFRGGATPAQKDEAHRRWWRQAE